MNLTTYNSYESSKGLLICCKLFCTNINVYLGCYATIMDLVTLVNSVNRYRFIMHLSIKDNPHSLRITAIEKKLFTCKRGWLN